MGWLLVWFAWLSMVAWSAALTALLATAVVARDYWPVLLGFFVGGWQWATVAACRAWR